MNENMNQDTNTNMDMNQNQNTNTNMDMNQNQNMSMNPNMNMDMNQNTNTNMNMSQTPNVGINPSMDMTPSMDINSYMNQNNPVEKKKSNKGLIILVILLLIIIILLVSYIVYDKLNDNVNNKNGGAQIEENIDEEEKIESRDLTQEELTYFKDHFNEVGINGFVGQSYSNIKDINLFYLLYVGIDDELVQLSDEEKQEYLKYSQTDDIYTSITKIEDDDLKEFLKENANLNHKKGSAINGFYYIPEYNAYYLEHGDTNYTEIESCSSGEIDENGNYIVNCTLKDYNGGAGTNIKTTLKNVDDNFVFVSNECESGNCETLKSNNNIGK